MHMKTVHYIPQETEAIACLVQVIFSSNLRSFWKVINAPPVEESTDQGLIALRVFRTEFKKLEQEDARSAIGISYC